MAKAKHPATDDGLVPTLQDNDFADPEPKFVEPRGSDLQEEIIAVRETRAAQRTARGKEGKRRKITHYQDAERLRALGLLTADEVVDCEENELFAKPEHYATGGGGSNPVDG